MMRQLKDNFDDDDDDEITDDDNKAMRRIFINEYKKDPANKNLLVSIKKLDEDEITKNK